MLEIPRASSNRPNFINQLPAERISLPIGFYQDLALNAITLIAAAAFGYVYRLYLAGSFSWMPVAGALLPVMILNMLELMLTRSAWRRVLVVFLEVLIVIILAGMHLPIKTLGLVGLGMLVLIAIGEAEAIRDYENGITFRFFRVARPLFKKLMSAFVLFMVVAYIPYFNAKEDFLSAEQFSTFYDWTAGVAQNAYPDLKFTSTVQAFAESVARVELQKNTSFRTLFETAKERAVKDASVQVIDSLESMLGVQVSPEEPLMAVFYRYVHALIERLQTSTKDYFPIYVGVILYFLVRSFGAIYHQIASGAAFFFYQLLLALNIIHVVGEGRTKETIEFS